MTIPRGQAQTLEEIELVENHAHTEQICFGNSGGVLTDGALTPFQFTSNAAAGVFGNEVQIYAGALGAGVYLDLDKVIVTAIQRTGELYAVEFWAGSGLFAAATRVSSFYYETLTATFRAGETLVRSPRVRGDLNIWGRTKCTFAGASTIDMVFMSHKYPSDSGDVVDS